MIFINDGGRFHSRYFLFHIPVVLEKKLELVQYGGYRKLGEKVVVKEVGCFSEISTLGRSVGSQREEKSLVGVKARVGR